MSADNNTLADLGISLDPQEGTVAAFLALPTPPATHRRIAGASFCFSIACAAMAALSIYVGMSDYLHSLAFLCDYWQYEVAGAIASLLATIGLLVYSHVRNLPKQDTAVAVKKAVVKQLIRCERAGISMSTPMQAIGIRSFHVLGTHGQAVDCWLGNFKLTPQDFATVKPADFGAVDFEVNHKGHLLVFFDFDTAERIREKQYQKGRGRHA